MGAFPAEAALAASIAAAISFCEGALAPSTVVVLEGLVVVAAAVFPGVALVDEEVPDDWLVAEAVVLVAVAEAVLVSSDFFESQPHASASAIMSRGRCLIMSVSELAEASVYRLVEALYGLMGKMQQIPSIP